MYDTTGQCIQQPAEPSDSTFKERVRLPAYPVQQLGGLIFAYLGPEPAPLLPRWDLLAWDNVFRDISVATLSCNWLQCVENSVDPIHLEWLHGRYGVSVLEREERTTEPAGIYFRHHAKIGFDLFEHGIIKRRIVEGQTEEGHDWQVGHPLIFPNLLRQGEAGRHIFQYRVPSDDTHTFVVNYRVFTPGPDYRVPEQKVIPLHREPVPDADGESKNDTINIQDYLVWVGQGEIADRTTERLAESDRGVILFRRLLQEQMKRVAEGHDPMNVFRDPAKNVCIELPQEEVQYAGAPPWFHLSDEEVSHEFGPQARQILEVLASRPEYQR
jgi:5,5'-dehydrodivanillate O-demethylase